MDPRISLAGKDQKSRGHWERRFDGFLRRSQSRLDGLLERDEVVGHAMIYGELLVGDRGGRAPLLSHYSRMRQAGLVAHDEVVAFIAARKLHGRGIGWIDAHLLASAVLERFSFWTADGRLEAVAAELNVGGARLAPA